LTGAETVFASDESVQAFEGESQVRAAFVVGYGVDLIDDDSVDAAEMFARFAGSEEDIEGLGGGDEDVGRITEHGGTLFGEGVAGADGGAYLGAEIAALHCELLDLGKGGVEIFLHIVGEGFERADVDDLSARRELTGERRTEELVDADQKRCESFSGAGGGGDEGSIAGENAGPAVGLRLGGAAEFAEEPLDCDGVCPGEGFGDFERHSLIVARFCSLFIRFILICSLQVLEAMSYQKGPLRAGRPLRGVYTFVAEGMGVALSLVGRGSSADDRQESRSYMLP
jgi:hypothetical protein